VDQPPPKPAADDDEPVPLFGSWRAIYTAVILVALAWIALSAVFSHWPY
jgi:hypothetical protein